MQERTSLSRGRGASSAGSAVHESTKESTRRRKAWNDIMASEIEVRRVTSVQREVEGRGAGGGEARRGEARRGGARRGGEGGGRGGEARRGVMRRGCRLMRREELKLEWWWRVAVGEERSCSWRGRGCVGEVDPLRRPLSCQRGPMTASSKFCIGSNQKFVNL
jgi:hypothetical protein